MKANDQENKYNSDAFALSILEHLGLQKKTLPLENASDQAMRALQSEAWTERVWAVRMCGQLSSETAIGEVLLTMLKDPIWQVRATTLFVLAEQRTAVSQEVFLSALSDKEEAVRAVAVRVLAMFGEHMPVDSIIAAASDPSWLVREAAILALGELGRYAPAASLVTALTDEDHAVREAALLTLRQHHPSAASAFISHMGENSLKQESSNRESWETMPSEPETETPSLPTAIPIHHSSPSSFKQKRLRWRLLESGIAALLLMSLLFCWLALTWHLPLSPAGIHPTQTPAEQTMFPSLQPGKILLTYRGEGGILTSQWTADSRYLGVSSDSASAPNQNVNGGEHIQVWDAATGKLTETVTLPSLPPQEQELSFFGADRYLVRINDQGLFQVWDYVSAQKLLDIHSPGLHGWPDWRWSKDQKWVEISSQKEKQVEIWDIVHGRQIASYPAPLAANVSLQWSPDDHYLAGLSNIGELKVWDAFTGKIVLSVSHDNGASLFWAPDNRQLVVTLPTENQMQLWDVLSGKQMFTFSGVAQSIRWTNNGERMLSYERTRWVVWDTQTGHAMATLLLSSKAWATVSPNGTSIAYAPGDNTLQIWDTILGHMVTKYDGFVGRGQLLTASWSSDNQVLALVGSNGVLLLWKASTETALAAYRVPLFPMPSLTWSPNARYIALSSQHPVLEIVGVGK